MLNSIHPAAWLHNDVLYALYQLNVVLVYSVTGHTFLNLKEIMFLRYIKVAMMALDRWRLKHRWLRVRRSVGWVGE